MNEQQLRNIVEGALLAAGRSLSLEDIQALFEESVQPDKGALKKAVDALREDYAERGIEIKETASGFRVQVKQEFSEWVSRLWEERPARYSRALLETLALVAYRQPITRAEIEDVRGVSVSTSIVRTLQERDWIRVVGHRDVPGRPAMYGTTKTFLDYFGLKSLDELPTLAELRDIDSINVELDLKEHGGGKSQDEAEDDHDGNVVEIGVAHDEAEAANDSDEDVAAEEIEDGEMNEDSGEQDEIPEADEPSEEEPLENARDENAAEETDEEATDVPEETTADDDAERT